MTMSQVHGLSGTHRCLGANYARLNWPKLVPAVETPCTEITIIQASKKLNIEVL